MKGQCRTKERSPIRLINRASPATGHTQNRGRKNPVYPLTLGLWPEAPAQKLKSGGPEHPKATSISRQLINCLGLGLDIESDESSPNEYAM